MKTILQNSPDLTDLPNSIDRPTIAVIDTAALRHNYAVIQGTLSPETEIMAVIKADAYGHGALAVAKLFVSLGARMLGVALPSEGAELRKGGITAPIIVLGGLFPEQIKSLFTYDLTPVVYDLQTINRIDRMAKKAGIAKEIHLKIDTGMSRLGVRPHPQDQSLETDTKTSKKKDEAIEPGELETLLTGLKNTGSIRLSGLLSHFAESDSTDKSFSDTQLRLFNAALETVRSFGFRPKYIHMANSAGAVFLKKSHFNLVRPGIMLYGAYPAPHLKESIDLKPALELKTRILQLKTVPKGTPISYCRTFVTKRESLIATLPIGYADGLPRALSSTYQLPHSLSHGGDVIVRGQRAPIAGVICMDLTMCDVTDVYDVKIGDEVVLIGRRGTVEITAQEIAIKTGTIPYEVLCSISGRVPRVYI